MDESKKERTPDAVAFGDTIILKADVSGIFNGVTVTFDIYDISQEPPMVIDNAKGKNEQGVAAGEWVMTDKSGKGFDIKLAFEAISKSKASQRCEIKCIKREILGYISLCLKNSISDQTMAEVECVVKGQQTEYVGKTDVDGLVVWNDLPLDNYLVEIRTSDLNLTKVVFWKKDSTKIQTIRVRQDLQ